MATDYARLYQRLYHELLYEVNPHSILDKRTDNDAHLQTMVEARYGRLCAEKLYELVKLLKPESALDIMQNLHQSAAEAQKGAAVTAMALEAERRDPAWESLKESRTAPPPDPLADDVTLSPGSPMEMKAMRAKIRKLEAELKTERHLRALAEGGHAALLEAIRFMAAER